MGYETSAERWSPVQSVEKILLSVVSMLAGKTLSEWVHLNTSIFTEGSYFFDNLGPVVQSIISLMSLLRGQFVMFFYDFITKYTNIFC